MATSMTYDQTVESSFGPPSDVALRYADQILMNWLLIDDSNNTLSVGFFPFFLRTLELVGDRKCTLFFFLLLIIVLKSADVRMGVAFRC